MRRAAAVALLAAGCKLLLGDPDRIVALEIVGPTKYTLPVDDTLQLRARARAANGDTVIGAMIWWSSLDTGQVGIALDTATGRVIGQLLGTWQVQARVEDTQSDAVVRTDAIVITVVTPAP